MSSLAAIHLTLIDAISRDLCGEPSFPTCMDAATLIRDTLSDPEADMLKVVRVVSTEPLIASKVLRVANTAARNTTGRPITELTIAIHRLGFECVRTISLAVALDQMLKTHRQASFARLAQIAWEHSLSVAAIARLLASQFPKISPDQAMLAGLVRDIGVFYLLYRASSIPAYAQNEALLLELLKGWHDSIGEHLLHALGLPEVILSTLRDPLHRCGTEIPGNLHDVLYFADLLTDSSMPWNELSDNDAIREADKARFAPICEAAREEIRQLKTALSG